MLSNTATPYYYGKFRDAVLRGEIPVCETITMEMNRIDNLIADPRYYYDDKKVEAVIKFCENELTLTDGSDVHMIDTFKLWIEQIFGWYYFDPVQKYVQNKTRPGGHFERVKVKKRLITKMYLIIARGAAKSMFLSFIQSYFLAVDPSTTKQLTTAPTLKLADAVMEPIITSITRARGPYYKFLTQGNKHSTNGNKDNQPKLRPVKEGILNSITNSTLEKVPMTVNKCQGYGAKIATIDEWLSGDTKEDVIEAIEQGCRKNKNDDYLIIAASSEGTVRNSVGDSMKMELMDILKGKYKNDHVSIWYYKLDDIKEIADPALWPKANPNIGQTISWNAYRDEVETAEHVPAKRNDILAKMFGIPMEGYTYFFTYEETKRTKARQDCWRMQCSMGVDLSRGDDFCAFTFLFPFGNGAFAVKVRSYITQYTLDNLPRARREKYQEFINEGSLIIMDDPRYRYLEIQQVYDDLIQYIEENEYDVQAVGYDPAGAKEFIERWEKEENQTGRGIELVRQGARTESIPLGEIKNIISSKQLYFDEELLTYGLGNCIVLEDTNGNRKLKKPARDKKIDNVAALVDAWVAFKLNKDNFM